MYHPVLVPLELSAPLAVFRPRLMLPASVVKPSLSVPLFPTFLMHPQPRLLGRRSHSPRTRIILSMMQRAFLDLLPSSATPALTASCQTNGTSWTPRPSPRTQRRICPNQNRSSNQTDGTLAALHSSLQRTRHPLLTANNSLTITAQRRCVVLFSSRSNPRCIIETPLRMYA